MEREKKPENIQKAVRSVIVSLAPANEIYNYFSLGDSLKDDNSFSLLKFVVEVKGDGNDLRYTLFGGKIKEGENFSEAIQREIVEEAGLIFYGIPRQTILGVWRYFSVKSGEREVVLTYNPALVCEKKLIGDSKIRDIRMMNLSEFFTLIQQGEFEGVPLEGHLSLRSDSPDQIKIDDENNQRKNQALLRTLIWMINVDAYLKKKFSQIFQTNPHTSFNEFEKQYEQIASSFMRRGLEVGIKQKEKLSCHELIEALDSSFLGRDILYYLPELSVHGIDWSGLSEATQSTQIFVKFLKDAFDDFLKEQGLTFEKYKETIRNPNILLDKKNDSFKQLNAYFRKRLMSVFGVSEDELDSAYYQVQNFFRDLSNELKVADPNLTLGLYQDFVLTNEVNNADIGTLLSIFLDFYTHELGSIQRFEAGRQLLLIFKALVGIKPYQELAKINREGGRLQLALNNFFGSPIREEIVDIGDYQQMRVRIRTINGNEYIVDEKPPKTFASFLRKSFFEKVADIKDFYSVSVVIKHSVGLNNVDIAADLIPKFVEYLKNQFPRDKDNIKSSPIEAYGTEDFKRYLNNPNETKLIDSRGKRVGSLSNRFVRYKSVITIGDESLELVVYPFMSLSEETEGLFFGWLDKIKDDKNYVVRRMLSGFNGIPSFYDLLFPPNIYPRHYTHRLNSNYHNQS